MLHDSMDVFVRLMLEKGARIDVRDDMGRMAIHLRRRETWKTFRQSSNVGQMLR